MKWHFPDWLARSLDDREMPFRLFLVYLLIFPATHGRIVDLLKVEVVALASIGLLVPALIRRWEYWALAAAMFAVNLIYSFEHSANHYFLTTYTCLALTVMTFREAQGTPPQLNLPRALLVITFGFATLHKFLSEYFMSGRLLASYFLRGKTFHRPLEWVYPDFQETVSTYLAQLDAITETASVVATSVPITVPEPRFASLCVALAMGIAVGEAAVFALLAWKKSFYATWFPYVLLGFVWGTFLFRNELTFFSLLCILGLLGFPQAGRRARFLLAGSAVLLLALSLNEIYLRL